MKTQLTLRQADQGDFEIIDIKTNSTRHTERKSTIDTNKVKQIDVKRNRINTARVLEKTEEAD